MEFKSRNPKGTKLRKANTLAEIKQILSKARAAPMGWLIVMKAVQCLANSLKKSPLKSKI